MWGVFGIQLVLLPFKISFDMGIAILTCTVFAALTVSAIVGVGVPTAIAWALWGSAAHTVTACFSGAVILSVVTGWWWKHRNDGDETLVKWKAKARARAV